MTRNPEKRIPRQKQSTTIGKGKNQGNLSTFMDESLRRLVHHGLSMGPLRPAVKEFRSTLPFLAMPAPKR